jgi:hypothetical protein
MAGGHVLVVNNHAYLLPLAEATINVGWLWRELEML